MSLIFRAESARNRQPDPIHSSLLLLIILFFFPLLLLSLRPALQSPLLFPVLPFSILSYLPFLTLHLLLPQSLFFAATPGPLCLSFQTHGKNGFVRHPVSSQTSRQTKIPSTICPSIHLFLCLFITHTSVRGERSLSASSTLGNSHLKDPGQPLGVVVPHLRASISSLQDLQLDSSYMGKRLEQQPMYPHYTYYYPHYLQTKVGWSTRLTYFTPLIERE